MIDLGRSLTKCTPMVGRLKRYVVLWPMIRKTAGITRACSTSHIRKEPNMPSQLDLDQGGTNRQMTRIYLGPSIGWITTPEVNSSLLSITAAGTTNILRSTTLILINVLGTVSVQLPTAKSSPAGDAVLPGIAVFTPITVVDAGGNANATTHLYSILP